MLSPSVASLYWMKLWLTQNVKLEAAPDWQARDPTSISGLICILGQDTWTFCCCAYRKPKVLIWPSACCLFTKNQNIHRLTKDLSSSSVQKWTRRKEGFRAFFLHVPPHLTPHPTFPQCQMLIGREKRANGCYQELHIFYFSTQNLRCTLFLHSRERLNTSLWLWMVIQINILMYRGDFYLSFHIYKIEPLNHSLLIFWEMASPRPAHPRLLPLETHHNYWAYHPTGHWVAYFCGHRCLTSSLSPQRQMPCLISSCHLLSHLTHCGKCS